MDATNFTLLYSEDSAVQPVQWLSIRLYTFSSKLKRIVVNYNNSFTYPKLFIRFLFYQWRFSMKKNLLSSQVLNCQGASNYVSLHNVKLRTLNNT